MSACKYIGATAWLAAACGLTKIDDDDDDAVPEAVQQRLTASCAIEGGACHTSGATPPDLSAGSSAWVTQSSGNGPYVTFGDIDNSYLITKMFDSPPSGSRMPLPPGELSAEDQSIIVGWVAGVEFANEDGRDTDDETGTTNDTGEDTASSLTLCSLEAMDPATPSPIDAGDAAGQIPTVIGAALEANCGCHYAETAELPYLAIDNIAMDTLADFQADYAGAVEQYTGRPNWQAVEDRVVVQQTMPTVTTCETEEGGTMTAADLALFAAWFEQSAPDGASFVPPA